LAELEYCEVDCFGGRFTVTDTVPIEGTQSLVRHRRIGKDLGQPIEYLLACDQGHNYWYHNTAAKQNDIGSGDRRR
jgi:hypothetical protein